jgi:hypothetical protein
MIIGSFNGASILAFPARPGLRQLELVMNDTVSVTRSPFTGQTQLQAWPGADWWEANLTLPQMPQCDAQIWTAFLAQCRGMSNLFALGDPLHAQPSGTPRGTTAGAPTVAGVNSAMATSLNTKGWLPSAMGLLLPGDQLQIGQRLHRVLDQVNSDSSGNAAISIWPSIREATADGDPLTLNNPRGLFRLAENRRSVLTTETLLSGISLKCVEAR